MATQLYQSLASNWDTAISTGVTATVQNAIAANAVLLASAITLWVILSGVATMFSRMTMQEWVFGAVRAAFLGILLTTAGFSQWIQTPLMTTIPTWIAQSINGGFGATTGPQQFDSLRDTVVQREAAILQAAACTTCFGERIRGGVVTFFICLELTISFGIWEGARGMMGLVVGVSPFVLFLYLFNPLRQIALNLSGVAISLLVLDVMVATLLSISITANQAFLNAANAPGADVEVQLDTMLSIAMFFLFSMGMTVFLPVLASRVGQGVLPHVAAGVGSPLNVAERTARQIGNLVHRIRNRNKD